MQDIVKRNFVYLAQFKASNEEYIYARYIWFDRLITIASKLDIKTGEIRDIFYPRMLLRLGVSKEDMPRCIRQAIDAYNDSNLYNEIESYQS